MVKLLKIHVQTINLLGIYIIYIYMEPLSASHTGFAGFACWVYNLVVIQKLAGWGHSLKTVKFDLSIVGRRGKIVLLSIFLSDVPVKFRLLASYGFLSTVRAGNW